MFELNNRGGLSATDLCLHCDFQDFAIDRGCLNRDLWDYGRSSDLRFDERRFSKSVNRSKSVSILGAVRRKPALAQHPLGHTPPAGNPEDQKPAHAKRC